MTTHKGRSFRVKLKRHQKKWFLEVTIKKFSTNSIAKRIMNKLKITVTQGNGIRKEVIPEGIKILESLSTRFNIYFAREEFDWSCEYYAISGKMMPDNGLQQLAEKDAIF